VVGPVSDGVSEDGLAARRERVSRLMVLVLPGFGRWASKLRDFETPYGKAGIRQLEVLYVLRHELLDPSKPTATALAEYFNIQRSVLTRILVKLESAGYITREPDPDDGRAWQVTITENGRNLSDYVERAYFKEMATALGEIEEADLKCLERSMAILTQVSIGLGNSELAMRILLDPARS
jgi:DNA-binding MarR family transcriptional regulator